MYHENVKLGFFTISYYDTIDEIPDACKVRFPDGERRIMTENEMLSLAFREEWYVIVNECNYGVCDHWVSIPFSKWIREHYPRISYYEDKGKIIGYIRLNTSVSLTKDKDYWEAEVWNS